MGGTLVLTFDNLGEATQLERGEDPQVPHPSVTHALPRLLGELATRELRATFFVEAINCELNPDAVRSIAAHGHELALHGWRHEEWTALPAERERDLLHRSVDAFARLESTVRGFRPPGGELARGSPALLREAGLEWCSPVGGDFARRDGLAYVPFEWELVDAYHLMERFAARRGERPLDPSALARRWTPELDRLAAGGMRVLVLHPFLMLDERWFDCVRALLDRVRASGIAVVTGLEACHRIAET